VILFLGYFDEIFAFFKSILIVVEFDIDWQHSTEFLQTNYTILSLGTVGNEDPFVRWKWEDGPNGPAEGPVVLLPVVEMCVPDFEGEVMEQNTPFDPNTNVKYFPQGKLTGEIDDDLLLHTRRMTQVMLTTSTSGTLGGQSTTLFNMTIPSFGFYPKLGGVGTVGNAFTVNAIDIGPDMWLSSAYMGTVGGCVHNIRDYSVNGNDLTYVFESNRFGLLGSNLSFYRSNSFDFASIGGSILQTSIDTRNIVTPDRLPIPMRSQRLTYALQTGTVCDSTITLFDRHAQQLITTSKNTVFYRSGGEDFRVGGWLGPPLLILGN